MNSKSSRIAVIGLGLMGGSLGSALVQSGYQVTGWDTNPATVKEAYQVGALSRLPSSLEDAISGCKFIFVATSVESIAPVIQSCLPWAAKGAIFSDLGSIKEKVIEEVFTFLPDDFYFVPGHPMTGSEKHGIVAVDPFLFENAAYIIVQDQRTPLEATMAVQEVVRGTGAQLIEIDAASHDRIVAMVSHLPHLVSALLAETAGMAEEAHPGTLALAAGGFRDTTRIAMGSPNLWTEIIFGNRGKIEEALSAFEGRIHELRSILSHYDREGLTRFLENAREVRMQVPAKNKGFLSLLYEMVVTIADRPGAIEEILHDLSRAKINIKDIEILRVREGDAGTLRLAFEDDDSVEKAVALLQKQGCKAWRR